MTAWALGAAVSTRLGLWVGLGCTAMVLGAAVSAREWAYLRHLLRPRAWHVVAGLLVGVGMTVATKLLYLPVADGLPVVARDVAYLYGKLSEGGPLRWHLAVVLVPVILGEEVVWRGLVQGAAERRCGAALAVPLAASMYALAHAPVGSPSLVAAAFFCGLVWGTLRAFTGGLLAPLLAHLLWDAMILLVSPLLPR
ncbi:MAG: CPBP family intramembrane metalloprotease [Deltaproteobacteria bacterium]|nr:CPBP family intramembrane metalloprotease [Deltaproteobacteria bacterium]